MTELMTKIFDPKTVSLETIGGTRGSGLINREQVINAVAMAGQKAPQGFDALMVKISEAVLCGLLTVTVYHGFRMFGLQHESAAIFIGGAVGCLGAQEVRELMQSVINPVISAIASKRGVKNGRINEHPNILAFLDMLAWAEGTSTHPHTKDDGYDVIVNGDDGDPRPNIMTSYARHPNVLVKVNTNLKSTAAGRYQLLNRYYGPYARLLRLPDFSPLCSP